MMTKWPPTIYNLTKRDHMQILKEHIIPEVIQIQLVQYNTGLVDSPRTAMRVPHYEVHWRFWRENISYKSGDERGFGWAGANWSHATTIKLEGEQWFDLAVARCSSLIIMGRDIPIDIMHDHEPIE
jgi:hypothetical protein